MGRPKGSRNKPKVPLPLESPKPAPAVSTPMSTPPVAWTKEDWQKNPTVQHMLKSLLDDPILRMAFQSLLVQALPAARAAVYPNVSAEALAQHDAFKLHNRSGFVGFYRSLHNLALLKGEPEPTAGWGTAELVEEDE